RECNIDIVGIGVASSLYPTVYFLGCIIMPKFLPHLKGKSRILIAQTGMALTALVLTLLETESAIMADLVFYGLFQSLLWTNMETWITQGKEGAALTSRLTLFNFSWSFSVGIATSAAGFLSEINTRLSLLSAAIAFLAAFFLTFSSPWGDKEKETKEEKKVIGHSSTLRFPSWTGVLLVYTGYSLVLTVFPQYALDSLGISESVTGNILLFRGLSVTLAFLVMQKYRSWQKGLAPILVGQCLFALLTLFMASAKSPIAFSVLFALYGAVFALSYNLSIFHGADGAVDRHKRMVIHEVLLTIGTIAGSLIGGYVYQYFSFSTLVYTIFAVSALTVMVECVLSLRWKRNA
ncbi:MAG: MFS transporter, partial [Candidatus Ornithospirochaeta sp.]